MSLTHISLDEATLAELDATSTAITFSRETALKEAIRNYSEYDRWFRAKVEEGRRAYFAGDVCSSEDVEREAQLRRAEILAKIKAGH